MRMKIVCNNSCCSLFQYNYVLCIVFIAIIIVTCFKVRFFLISKIKYAYLYILEIWSSYTVSKLKYLAIFKSQQQHPEHSKAISSDSEEVMETETPTI